MIVTEKEIVSFEEDLQQSRRSANTILIYGKILRQFFLEYLTNKDLKELTKKDIYGFETWLEKRGDKRKEMGFTGRGEGRERKGKTLSSSSLNLYYSAIRQFLTFSNNVALAKEIKSLPIKSVYNIIEFEDLVRACGKKEIERFYETKLKTGRDHKYFNFYVERLRLILVFLLSHGTRIDELYEIEKSNLKTELKNKILIIEHGKGDEQRVVPLSQDWLNEWNQFIEAYPKVKQSKYLFTNVSGNRIAKGTIQTYINQLATFLEIKGLSPHKFRHGFAFIADQSSEHNLQYVQILLGHKNINTTTIYTKTFGNKMTDLPNPFDGFKKGESI